jgi:hypothetical protein
MIKNKLNILINAIVGLVVGVLTTFIIYVIWIISSVSIIGGIIGGLIPREGTRKDQFIFAVIISGALTTPVALFFLWYTGY